ncbi:MAG: protease HtpX [Gammaproteobacteria bacterium]|nr:protease HtpX [Gammaproteobacteria bacterium]MCZ6827244.1 protease HtpX [Gammaproteobacteria bacterium]MCZ6912117.1 protease HtpX [Pseudomonadota bacterium]
MKRIGLFLVTNIAVILVLSIAMRLLGADIYLAQQGYNYQALLVFSAVFGMGGAFISLSISKWAAKRSTGAQVIEQPANETERWLLSTVEHQARQVGIGMPEVAIFPSPEPNAFATGAKRDAALVAVSEGLLQQMTRDEIEAVLAHEISHVANGDMVTMTLIQGVLNTFVLFLSRIIGGIVNRVVFRSNSNYGIGYFVSVIITQLVLGILASFIVAWFSRYREFRADAGSAKLAGRHKMIAALERLKRAHAPAQLPKELNAFGIFGGGQGGLMQRLRMSHPPLDERIRSLREANIHS